MLEILKNEDDLIIQRLSEKKLFFKYKIPIQFKSGETFNHSEIKVRYKIGYTKGYAQIDKKLHNHGNYFGNYTLITTHHPLGDPNRLRRIFSIKYGIKMENIKIISTFVNHLNYNFYKPSAIIIDDIVFEREVKIKKLI